MKGQRRLWILSGWVFLFTPPWAMAWMTIKIQEPPERWEVAMVSFAPAPLELPVKPLQLSGQSLSFWSYPTEAQFVAYPEQPHYNAWVAQALEKYQIRLVSPMDVPYSPAPLAFR